MTTTSYFPTVSKLADWLVSVAKAYADSAPQEEWPVWYAMFFFRDHFTDAPPVLANNAMESLLREAAQAHHAYEEETGEADPEWATWYARYMVEHRDKFPISLKPAPYTG